MYHITYSTSILIHTLIFSFLLLMTGVFLQAGYITTVVFDKRYGRLALYQINAFCNRQVRDFRLEDIKSVRAVQRGFKNRQTNTLHNKIVIEFVNHSPIGILETHSSIRIKKEVGCHL
jgi:hypothetical protein